VFQGPEFGQIWGQKDGELEIFRGNLGGNFRTILVEFYGTLGNI
jgi:hypothetical protein